MKIKSIIFKTSLVAAIKALAAFIAFFLTVAIARVMGAEESGLFLLALSILSFGSVFFRLGLDGAILRLISADEGSARSINTVSTGLLWCLAASLSFSLLTYFFAEFITNSVFSKPELSPVLSVMIWALPLMVVSMLLSSGFQAFYRVIAATYFQNLGLSSLFLFIFIFSYYYLNDSELHAAQLSYYYLSASFIICVLAILMWHRQIKGAWGGIRLKNKELWVSSSNIWAANTMSLMVQWSGILIAGTIVSASDIAYLSAAQRTAMLTSFVLMVVNMVVAPRYARLWQENKIQEIKNLAKWSTRSMIVLASPLVAVMIFMPEQIMNLFGEEFLVAGNLLAIMAAGQFINVATGSVGYLLNMSGHEKDFRRVTFFSGPLTIFLSYFLIIEHGVQGAAIATAVGLSLQNLLALAMVRKRLGFWPIG